MAEGPLRMQAYMDVTTTRKRQVGARALAWLVVVVVLVGAFVGVAATLMGQSGVLGGHSTEGTGYHVGDHAETPFGTVTVTEVGQVNGVTHRALSGATHGVQGYVDAEHLTIQTAITLTNGSKSHVAYSEQQFRLRITRAGRTWFRSASGGDLPDTPLAPHSGLAGHLDFTIRRTRATLALVFDPPGRGGPIVIKLGRSVFDPRAPGQHIH
jgi:hypothetical protein